jgi:hypothetical protein
MANDIVLPEPFDPRKIYNELIKRCKRVREWFIFCIVDESWIPKEDLPFEIVIMNGIYCCRVITPTHSEAIKIISNTLPVIRFIDEGLNYDE